MTDLRSRILEVADFPKQGILFRDLLPLVSEPKVFQQVIQELSDFAAPLQPSVVLGAEARGFLFGPTLAFALGCGFAPARKPGKLPGAFWSESYALEYGSNTLELAHLAIEPGARVLIHDDLLATGGTAAAAIALLKQAGAEVIGACFVAELKGLAGRSLLGDVPILSLVEYDGA